MPDVTITFTSEELAAVDEALAITEQEDRLPSHEAAFAKVRAAAEEANPWRSKH